MQKNQLYYGDNLEVLRDYIKDESVDLIYLDPPFNSRADYNVLFSAGFYKSPAYDDKHFPRIQIITIEEILAGKGIDFPHLLETTFKQAPKAKAKKSENLTLDLG